METDFTLPNGADPDEMLHLYMGLPCLSYTPKVTGNDWKVREHTLNTILRPFTGLHCFAIAWLLLNANINVESVLVICSNCYNNT